MNLGIPKRHHPRRIWGDLRCGADSRGRGGRQEARGKVFGAFCAVPVGQNGAPLKEVHPCQRAVHEAVPNEFYRYDHQGPSDEFEEYSFGNFFNPENPEVNSQSGREHQKERDKGALHIDLPKPNIGDQLYGVAVGKGNDRSADED